MSTTKPRILETHRRRMKQRGYVRLEVRVHARDAAILREVARALGDPERQEDTRALLRERFGAGKAAGLKDLLASAPLEGVDLEREQDVGRNVDL